MDKGVGFSRKIRLDWLDAAAAMRQEGIKTDEMRERLARVIENEVRGEKAQQNTISVLMSIWVSRTPKIASELHEDALRLMNEVSSQERIWLHYGVTLLCYPFFRACLVAIGQAGRTESSITWKILRDRLATSMGHLGSLDRSSERVVASLVDWKVLQHEGQNTPYKICQRAYSTSHPELEAWLLACALHVHPASEMPFVDLLNLPELFPFKFSIGVESLRASPAFEIHQQGLDLVMVQAAQSWR